jgi:uncharacterized protein (DUF885 family)
MRKLFATLVLLAPFVCGAADTAAHQAHALFERDWEWRLRHQPELATTLGDHRFDALLSDTSLAARQEKIDHDRRMLEAALLIDRAQLEGQDRISWDLFVAARERDLALAALLPVDPHPLTAHDGIHVRLPQLVAQMPFATEADYRRYIARLEALPRHVDGLVEQMREGVALGWVAPKAAVQALPAALQALRERLPEGPLAAPFNRIPSTIEPEVRAGLAAAGAAALATSAAPALLRLEDFVRLEYLPAARETVGAASLPAGQEYYALLARQATGTAMTPADIHALGLKEVARIRGEMLAVIARTGFRGDFEQFLEFARSDPRLFFSDADALLTRYRRAIARARARLPELFATVPDTPVGVKPMAADGAASQIAAYYEAGSARRMAALVVNTARLDTRPIWQVDSIALHEALPGHHLQVARAQALADLPAFRRYGWDVAFGEGWATYAEGLGAELGFFRDPFSLFGHLNEEMLRAARLVVDTGIHALGWPRQQAIDYLNANTANPPSDNEVEVDRYIARPAQALGYQVGALRIRALRDRAQAALGERFELRQFHDAVLGNGAVSLPILERQLEAWTASQAGSIEAPAAT